jgi:predicted short-subunit dehydrogenase-like oxidoreductase (DUF2520 family)
MEVVIIGTGNVAHALAMLIKASDHVLLEVSGRNPAHLKKMATEREVSTSSLVAINKKADLYIVAVTDDALNHIGDWLSLEKKMVVHTAGSVSKDVLKKVSRNYGVLYPLQSLKAQMNVLPEIPFLVDGNTPDDLALILDFALSISGKVEVADDEARRKLHLAAVFVNNFTNHLYALAEAFCEREKLPFEFLHPLINETAHRLQLIPAKDAQTGPAARDDINTIQKQMEMLKDFPEMLRVYELMTESIRRSSTSI